MALVVALPEKEVQGFRPSFHFGPRVGECHDTGSTKHGPMHGDG